MQGNKRGLTNTKKRLKALKGKKGNYVRYIYFFFFLGGVLWMIGLIYFLSSQMTVTEAPEVEAISEIVIKEPIIRFFSERNCVEESFSFEVKDDGSEQATNLCNRDIKSAILIANDNNRIIDVFSSCSSAKESSYAGSIFPLDGCVNIYHYPKVANIKFTDSNLEIPQIDADTMKAQYMGQEIVPIHDVSETPKVRILFSCESSEYFGYQVWANFFGFLTSGQTSASWTRLMTGKERDDLADHLPGLATFQAKRHLYSHRYSPINKADVIEKFFASIDSPKEEIMLVIDPDNWLLKDVDPWVKRVKKGYALGEAAYYHGSKTAQKLWKELCERNCDVDLDLVGVPYVVHRDDLEAIAPLWKHYSLRIKENLEKDSPIKDEFEAKYKKLDVNWAAEMFGYNMASAHVGVKHEVIRKMQIRDVAGTRSFEKLKDVAMIHMGRAWFPPDAPIAKKYAHTEGKSFSRFGQQVWCKCNYTASTIIPWPIPEGTDFQSTKTLELLHNSIERFGPIPNNYKFRHNVKLSRDYGWKMP